jgi:hypothetical protein
MTYVPKGDREAGRHDGTLFLGRGETQRKMALHRRPRLF